MNRRARCLVLLAAFSLLVQAWFEDLAGGYHAVKDLLSGSRGDTRFGIHLGTSGTWFARRDF